MSFISFLAKIMFYKRYIDDIFIKTYFTPNTIVVFERGSRTEHLKLTMQCDRESISFLDLKVHISEGKLQNELYRKPIDHNMILRGDGFHPEPLINNLPISQIKRVHSVQH